MCTKHSPLLPSAHRQASKGPPHRITSSLIATKRQQLQPATFALPSAATRPLKSARHPRSDGTLAAATSLTPWYTVTSPMRAGCVLEDLNGHLLPGLAPLVFARLAVARHPHTPYRREKLRHCRSLYLYHRLTYVDAALILRNVTGGFY